MSKKTKVALHEKVYRNIDLARTKLSVDIIMKDGQKVGRVIHRLVDNPAGTRWHTSVILGGWIHQVPTDPVYGYYVSGGSGYNKAAHNMCYFFVENREQIEALTGVPYPEDPDLYTYFANYWRDYLKKAGYTIIYAL